MHVRDKIKCWMRISYQNYICISVFRKVPQHPGVSAPSNLIRPAILRFVQATVQMQTFCRISLISQAFLSRQTATGGGVACRNRFCRSRPGRRCMRCTRWLKWPVASLALHAVCKKIDIHHIQPMLSPQTPMAAPLQLIKQAIYRVKHGQS